MIDSFFTFLNSNDCVQCSEHQACKAPKSGFVRASQPSLDLSLSAWFSLAKPTGSTQPEASRGRWALRALEVFSFKEQKRTLPEQAEIYQVVPRTAGRAREAYSGLRFQEQCPELSHSTDVMKKRLLPPSSTGHIAVISAPRTKPHNHGYCPCWQKGTESECLYYVTSHRVKNWIGWIWRADALPRACGSAEGSAPDWSAKEVFAICQNSQGKEFSNVEREGASMCLQNKDLMSISWHSKIDLTIPIFELREQENDSNLPEFIKTEPELDTWFLYSKAHALSSKLCCHLILIN